LYQIGWMAAYGQGRTGHLSGQYYIERERNRQTDQQPITSRSHYSHLEGLANRQTSHQKSTLPLCVGLPSGAAELGDKQTPTTTPPSQNFTLTTPDDEFIRNKCLCSCTVLSLSLKRPSLAITQAAHRLQLQLQTPSTPSNAATQSRGTTPSSPPICAAKLKIRQIPTPSLQ
jgi:hypothetical protein